MGREMEGRKGKDKVVGEEVGEEGYWEKEL